MPSGSTAWGLCALGTHMPCSAYKSSASLACSSFFGSVGSSYLINVAEYGHTMHLKPTNMPDKTNLKSRQNPKASHEVSTCNRRV